MQRIIRLLGGSGGTETLDSATIYIDIQPSGTEYLTHEYTDAATVYVDIQPSGTEQHIHTDAATVYIDITNTGGECYSTVQGSDFGEGEAQTEWVSEANTMWSSEAQTEWADSVNVVDGVTC